MAPLFPIDEAPDATAKRVMHNALRQMHGGEPLFKWVEDDNRSLIGCYAPLCYTTAPWTPQFFELLKLCYSPGEPKPRNRELAILGFSSILDAPYVVHTHRGVALKAGLTEEPYNDGTAGQIPKGLSKEERMAYRLGRLLTNLNGPLDDETWKDVVSVMDRSDFITVVHTIAGYR